MTISVHETAIEQSIDFFVAGRQITDTYTHTERGRERRERSGRSTSSRNSRATERAASEPIKRVGCVGASMAAATFDHQQRSIRRTSMPHSDRGQRRQSSCEAAGTRFHVSDDLLHCHRHQLLRVKAQFHYAVTSATSLRKTRDVPFSPNSWEVSGKSA